MIHKNNNTNKNDDRSVYHSVWGRRKKEKSSIDWNNNNILRVFSLSSRVIFWHDGEILITRTLCND